MTRSEAKEILSLYRPGSEDGGDPFFAEALQLVQEDQELAEWFAAEQTFDENIAQRLAAAEVPASLRASLLASLEPRPRFQWNWINALGLAAATAVITLLLSLNLAKAPGHAKSLVADYRAEMIGFVDLPPALAIQTGDLQRVREWLSTHTDVIQADFPSGTRQLSALGCRTLTFRGYPVALACFRRTDGELVHLLIVDRAAFGRTAAIPQNQFAKEGTWATEIWSEGNKVYMLATKGDRQRLETYL